MQIFLIYVDELLWCCVEDDWCFVMLVVWIVVLYFFNVQQCVFFLQQCNDDVVCFEDVYVIQCWISVWQISVVWVNWVSGFQVVFLIDYIVVWVVVRCGVNGIGIGIQGNVIVEDCWNVEVYKWMGKVQQFKFCIFYCVENGVIGYVDMLYYVFNQIFCQNYGLIVDLYQCIVEIWCNRDCVVGRQSLWCGGLDYQ